MDSVSERILRSLRDDGPGTLLDLAHRTEASERWVGEMLQRLLREQQITHRPLPSGPYGGRPPRLYHLEER